MSKHAVVIGAGHNGLVCAYYLAKGGVDVTVVEAKEIVGGACKTEELFEDVRFSTCANACCWLRPEIARDMGLLRRGVEFSVTGDPVHECYPAYTHLFPNRTSFTFWQDQAKTIQALEQHSLKDAEALPRWESFWNKAAEIFGPFLLTAPPNLEELVGRAEKLSATDILSTVLTTPLAHMVDRYFESWFMRNHFTAPHDIGSVYDTGSGIATALATAVAGYNPEGLPLPRGYVKGGMGMITQKMAEACEEEGVKIIRSTPVEQILVRSNSSVGVKTFSGEKIDADLVVSNADPKRTFLKLMAAETLSATFLDRVRSLRTDVAPLKFHSVVKGLPHFEGIADMDSAARGGIKLCPSRAHFEAAWEDAAHGRFPANPYLDLMIPTTWDHTLAPKGYHTVSAWILFAPVNLKEGTWRSRRQETADRIVEIIAAYSPDFREKLVDYTVFTPADLEERVLLTDGNIHHVDVHPSQMLWQRPLPELAHYRAPVEKLYLCGAGMHPYGEVCGAPGHNCAEAILSDLGE